MQPWAQIRQQQHSKAQESMPWERHCLVVTTVLDALKEEQYKRSRLLSRWACEGCLAGELHVLHGPREAPAPPELAGGAFTACQEHAGTLAKACPTAR